MKSLTALRVLVTGGTSGLGKALVEHLDEAQAQVTTFARAAAAVDRMREAHPKVRIFEADISKKEDTYRISAAAFQAMGGIDVLINNASSLGPTPLRLLLDTECEDFEAVLQTNLLGPFRLVKAVLPAMIAAKNGLILNISSDAAVNGYPGWGAYSSSKAALDHLTRVLNSELTGHGIRSVAIDPGDMNTPMHFQAIPDADPKALKDPNLSAKQILGWIRAGDHTQKRIKL